MKSKTQKFKKMRIIFTCKTYEVLSMDGLRYETKLDRLYNADKQTHIPIFERDKDLFVQVGNEVRKFDPKLIRYGFRYYDNDGNLSQPFTAVICELEGWSKTEFLNELKDMINELGGEKNGPDISRKNVSGK